MCNVIRIILFWRWRLYFLYDLHETKHFYVKFYEEYEDGHKKIDIGLSFSRIYYFVFFFREARAFAGPIYCV